jgi:hypothetical protein
MRCGGRGAGVLWGKGRKGRRGAWQLVRGGAKEGRRRTHGTWDEPTKKPDPSIRGPHWGSGAGRHYVLAQTRFGPRPLPAPPAYAPKGLLGEALDTTSEKTSPGVMRVLPRAKLTQIFSKAWRGPGQWGGRRQAGQGGADGGVGRDHPSIRTDGRCTTWVGAVGVGTRLEAGACRVGSRARASLCVEINTRGTSKRGLRRDLTAGMKRPWVSSVLELRGGRRGRARGVDW